MVPSLEKVGSVPGSSSWGVFLSYRREDAAPYARLLKLQLRERLPGAQVFMDLDSIEPGLDFAEVIREAVGSCVVLVALIGRQWSTLTDEDGAGGLTTRTTTCASKSRRHLSAACA